MVISEQIVKQFGGDINFKSEFNVGSEFWFSFKLEDMPIVVEKKS